MSLINKIYIPFFLIIDIRRWNNYCRCTFIHHQIWKIHSGNTCKSSSQLHALESCSGLNEILNGPGQKNITEIFPKTHWEVRRNTKVQVVLCQKYSFLYLLIQNITARLFFYKKLFKNLGFKSSPERSNLVHPFNFWFFHM